MLVEKHVSSIMYENPGGPIPPLAPPPSPMPTPMGMYCIFHCMLMIFLFIAKFDIKLLQLTILVLVIKNI